MTASYLLFREDNLGPAKEEVHLAIESRQLPYLRLGETPRRAKMIWILLPCGIVVILLVARLLGAPLRDQEQPRAAAANVIYLRPLPSSPRPEGSPSRRLAIIRRSSLLR
jgi:ADP-ribose pyrophosphatase YjhB (NUDIX family)